MLFNWDSWYCDKPRNIVERTVSSLAWSWSWIRLPSPIFSLPNASCWSYRLPLPRAESTNILSQSSVDWIWVGRVGEQPSANNLECGIEWVLRLELRVLQLSGPTVPSAMEVRRGNVCLSMSSSVNRKEMLASASSNRWKGLMKIEIMHLGFGFFVVCLFWFCCGFFICFALSLFTPI